MRQFFVVVQKFQAKIQAKGPKHVALLYTCSLYQPEYSKNLLKKDRNTSTIEVYRQITLCMDLLIYTT